MRSSILLLGLSAVLVSPPAGACSPVTYGIHSVDAAFADDIVPPSDLVVTARLADDDDGDGIGGCGGESSCGDLSAIVITASARDDRAPAERIGYRLRVIGGTAPADFSDDIVMPEYSDEMRFLIGQRRGFAFDLEVAAVDLNGNIGAPVVITVEG